MSTLHSMHLSLITGTTFDAPFSNNGYNYTYIDIMMGMSMQNVVCGVPYELMITFPMMGMPFPMGAPFNVDFEIVDRDGNLAQGYFTFSDGPIIWTSSDPMFMPPPPSVFDGTASPTPGWHSEMVMLLTIGPQTIELFEGGMPGNDFLTPWGGFTIDPDNSVPGWLDDWDIIQVDIV